MENQRVNGSEKNQPDFDPEVTALIAPHRFRNEKKQSSGVGLFNTAAALDQSWELLNPDLALQRGCALAVREGPTRGV